MSCRILLLMISALNLPGFVLGQVNFECAQHVEACQRPLLDCYKDFKPDKYYHTPNSPKVNSMKKCFCDQVSLLENCLKIVSDCPAQLVTAAKNIYLKMK